MFGGLPGWEFPTQSLLWTETHVDDYYRCLMLTKIRCADKFSKTPQNIQFHKKFCSAVLNLLHVDRHTDGHSEANTPKNIIFYIQYMYLYSFIRMSSLSFKKKSNN
jgi:hypothetical protein